uniref:Carcinustatin-10 n=1 Tax=Carcinus maenas TaxID=6759 RepID=ALL10_CARMA|nr:RecName: Full=Carcinustatin-10 [Carcinus maenas]
APQPYAFGL